MSASVKGIAQCPHCKRTISTSYHRYGRHALVKAGTEYCPMSKQRVPITGSTPTAYVSRAHLIGDLATQIRDVDPALVWTYVQHIPADELRRLLMLTLAAIPVDQTVEEMFAWVCELPAAKEISA